MKRDPRIDAYIARQAAFARPILEHLRAAVHAAYPDVEEAIRFGMPAFLHQGKMLCSMAAFKAHAGFRLWKGALMTATEGIERKATGQLRRITSLADLPDEASLKAMVGKAVALTEQGVRAVRPGRRPKAPPNIPADLRSALAANPDAARQFAAFSPAARHDYVAWIVEAKRPATRARRLADTVARVAEGKTRNWKFED